MLVSGDKATSPNNGRQAIYMSAFSENRIQYRLTGETLALMEEAADQFADDATLVAAIGIWDEKLTAAAKRLISNGEAGEAGDRLFDYEIMSLVPLAEEGVIGLLKHEQRKRAIDAMLALPKEKPRAFEVGRAEVPVELV